MFGFGRRRPKALTPESAVVTTRSVLRGESPIVLVAHMLSGDWQFMGNDEKRDEDLIAIHFGHLVELDAGLAELTGMRRGEMAYRVAGGQWTIELFFSDQELPS